jgi:hypothetical protein
MTNSNHTKVDNSDIDYLSRRVAALTKENDFLRAYTGNSDKACVYCGLGAEEQGQCVLGFPGCSRGDDQMLCREVGVGLERDDLRKLVAKGLAVVEDFMPNIGVCALQDYARLNEFLIEATRMTK